MNKIISPTYLGSCRQAAAVLAFVFTSFCQAAEPANTQQEIAHLFTTLESSNCQFNRNGSWYSAKEASGHLASKYKYLQNKDMVPTAEKFIERAATGSSFSGKAYQIRCVNMEAQPSGPWFQAVLQRYRTATTSK